MTNVSQMRPKQIHAKPTVISLFTCAMGMDIGFEKAGFETVYTNDISKYACKTIKRNRPKIPCDEGDIAYITTDNILFKSGLEKGEADVVIGGSPCQSFSTAGKRRGLGDMRGTAGLEFIRVVREVQPKFFVFENVPGLISMPIRHMSFYERIAKKGTNLPNDFRLGSLFKELYSEFKALRSYKTDWKVLGAADFGVSQKRERLIIIGSRTADPMTIFEELESKIKWTDPNNVSNGKKPWRTLRDALSGLRDTQQELMPFSRSWSKYLKYVPPGGCWVNIPKRIQKKAMGGALNSIDPSKKGKQGGRRSFFRRLSWDRPCPTLVTSPVQKGTCLCHPDELRPLSVKEYARIQGFPDQWEFVGSTKQKYRMIGEAVPIELARLIGSVIKKELIQ